MMILQSKNEARFKKAISLALVLALTSTNIATAAPSRGVTISIAEEKKQEARIDALASLINIPDSVGSIQDRYVPEKGSESTVIHVQDAHMSNDAQASTRAILSHLQKTYGVNQIFLEGGIGDIRPELLLYFKDKKLNEKLADRLQKESLIGGTELFLLDDYYQNHKATASGIENLDLYVENLKAFTKVMEKKELSTRWLNDFKSKIFTEASKVFGKELKEFFREWAFYQDAQDEAMRHIETLDQAVKTHMAVDFRDPISQVEWPQLVRVIRLKDLENKIDMKKANEEALQLKSPSKDFSELVKAVNNPQIKIKNPRKIAEQYLLENASKGFSYEKYPELSKALGKIILQSELDAIQLFNEMHTLTEKLLHHLAKTKAEKKVIADYHNYIQMRKLFALELIRSEFAQVSSQRNELLPSNLMRQHNRKDGEMDTLFETALSFYELAIKREETMFERVTKKMEETGNKTSVIVTGGFHSEGLAEKLKQKKIAYVEVMPRINNIQDTNNYAKTMTSIVGANQSLVNSPSAADTLPLAGITDLVRNEVEGLETSLGVRAEARAKTPEDQPAQRRFRTVTPTPNSNVPNTNWIQSVVLKTRLPKSNEDLYLWLRLSQELFNADGSWKYGRDRSRNAILDYAFEPMKLNADGQFQALFSLPVIVSVKVDADGNLIPSGEKSYDKPFYFSTPTMYLDLSGGEFIMPEEYEVLRLLLGAELSGKPFSLKTLQNSNLANSIFNPRAEARVKESKKPKSIFNALWNLASGLLGFSASATKPSKHYPKAKIGGGEGLENRRVMAGDLDEQPALVGSATAGVVAASAIASQSELLLSTSPFNSNVGTGTKNYHAIYSPTSTVAPFAQYPLTGVIDTIAPTIAQQNAGSSTQLSTSPFNSNVGPGTKNYHAIYSTPWAVPPPVPTITQPTSEGEGQQAIVYPVTGVPFKHSIIDAGQVDLTRGNPISIAGGTTKILQGRYISIAINNSPWLFGGGGIDFGANVLNASGKRLFVKLSADDNTLNSTGFINGEIEVKDANGVAYKSPIANTPERNAQAALFEVDLSKAPAGFDSLSIKEVYIFQVGVNKIGSMFASIHLVDPAQIPTSIVGDPNGKITERPSFFQKDNVTPVGIANIYAVQTSSGVEGTVNTYQDTDYGGIGVKFKTPVSLSGLSNVQLSITSQDILPYAKITFVGPKGHRYDVYTNGPVAFDKPHLFTIPTSQIPTEISNELYGIDLVVETAHSGKVNLDFATVDPAAGYTVSSNPQYVYRIIETDSRKIAQVLDLSKPNSQPIEVGSAFLRSEDIRIIDILPNKPIALVEFKVAGPYVSLIDLETNKSIGRASTNYVSHTYNPASSVLILNQTASSYRYDLDKKETQLLTGINDSFAYYMVNKPYAADGQLVQQLNIVNKQNGEVVFQKEYKASRTFASVVNRVDVIEGKHLVVDLRAGQIEVNLNGVVPSGTVITKTFDLIAVNDISLDGGTLSIKGLLPDQTGQKNLRVNVITGVTDESTALFPVIQAIAEPVDPTVLEKGIFEAYSTTQLRRLDIGTALSNPTSFSLNVAANYDEGAGLYLKQQDLRSIDNLDFYVSANNSGRVRIELIAGSNGTEEKYSVIVEGLQASRYSRVSIPLTQFADEIDLSQVRFAVVINPDNTGNKANISYLAAAPEKPIIQTGNSRYQIFSSGIFLQVLPTDSQYGEPAAIWRRGLDQIVAMEVVSPEANSKVIVKLTLAEGGVRYFSLEPEVYSGGIRTKYTPLTSIDDAELSQLQKDNQKAVAFLDLKYGGHGFNQVLRAVRELSNLIIAGPVHESWDVSGNGAANSNDVLILLNYAFTTMPTEVDAFLAQATSDGLDLDAYTRSWGVLDSYVGPQSYYATAQAYKDANHQELYFPTSLHTFSLISILNNQNNYAIEAASPKAHVEAAGESVAVAPLKSEGAQPTANPNYFYQPSRDNKQYTSPEGFEFSTFEVLDNQGTVVANIPNEFYVSAEGFSGSVRNIATPDVDESGKYIAQIQEVRVGAVDEEGLIGDKGKTYDLWDSQALVWDIEHDFRYEVYIDSRVKPIAIKFLPSKKILITFEDGGAVETLFDASIVTYRPRSESRIATAALSNEKTNALQAVVDVAMQVAQQTFALTLPSDMVRLIIDRLNNQTQNGRDQKAISVFKEALGPELAKLYDNAVTQGPIHLVIPIESGVDPETLGVLGAILQNPNDTIQLVAANSTRDQAKQLESKIHAAMSKMSFASLKDNVTVVGSGSTPKSIAQAIQKIAGRNKVGQSGVVDSRANLLGQIPVMGEMLRLLAPEELSEAVAIGFISAAYLRQLDADKLTQEEFISLQKWMNEKGIQSDSLMAKIGIAIEAMKHFEASA